MVWLDDESDRGEDDQKSNKKSKIIQESDDEQEDNDEEDEDIGLLDELIDSKDGPNLLKVRRMLLHVLSTEIHS